MKKMNKKGFTLMELLIVVAIIAVLIAISIPVMTSQLEKSREAVDAANIRSAYAEVMVAYLSGETGAALKKEVTLKQKQDGWQNTDFGLTGTFPVDPVNTPIVGFPCEVEVDSSNGSVTITFKQP